MATHSNIGASLVAQTVKNRSAMQETWVQSLSQEDPLEKGNGYPLQYSGLENSLGCVVHGVTKSWTQLSDFHVLRFLLCFHHWDETVHFWQE